MTDELYCYDCKRPANTECVEQKHRMNTEEVELMSESKDRQQLQKQTMDLMIKAMSAEIDAAATRAGKQLAEKLGAAVTSRQSLAEALGLAFVEGATYVFKRIGES